MGEMVSITAQGSSASGYLAVPATGSGSGVLVCHAWWGMTSFFTGLCDRLAEAGFVALVGDMYDGLTAGTIAEAEQIAEGLATEHAEGVVIGALDHLLAHPATTGNRIGAIGFSLGGHYALQLSIWRPDAVAAVVDFYGSAVTDYSTSTGNYLCHLAPHDEWEPDDQIEEMLRRLNEAGRPVTVHYYPGARHWFFEHDRPDAYDAEGALLAWDRTLAFLREHLSQP